MRFLASRPRKRRVSQTGGLGTLSLCNVLRHVCPPLVRRHGFDCHLKTRPYMLFSSCERREELAADSLEPTLVPAGAGHHLRGIRTWLPGRPGKPSRRGLESEHVSFGATSRIAVPDSLRGAGDGEVQGH